MTSSRDEPRGDSHKEEVLDLRARALAAIPAKQERRKLLAHVVVMSVGQERYAIAAQVVKLVLRPPPITPLPGLPRWIRGIVQVRGELMSVVDLARWFRVGAHTSEASHLVVLEGPRGLLGLLVDSVDDLRAIYEDEIARDLRDGSVGSDRGISHTTRDLVALIDPARLFGHPEIAGLDRAGGDKGSPDTT